MRSPHLYSLIGLALAGCAGSSTAIAPQPAPQAAAVTPGMALLSGPEAERRAAARLGFIASDELEGRETATRGGLVAARYLAEQLRSFGVEPAGDRLPDGSRSFFNHYRVRTNRLNPSRSTLVDPSGHLGELVMGRDWLAFAGATPTVPKQTLDVVLVGYGVGEPGMDSYAGLDVTGKLVVAVSGKPAGLDSVKAPNGRMMNAAQTIYKIGLAAKHGAAGFILVGSPQLLAVWDGIVPQLAGTDMSLADAPEQPTPPASPVPVIYANRAFGEHLLAALGAPASTLADANDRKPLPSRAATGVKLALELTPEKGEADAVNVVGMIPGSGMAQEFVGFGAHFDHHGIVAGQVYNGADDDGSGTVSMLDAAEAFARDRAEGRPTKRSLLFVFHSGEEKGLLGSEHFTDHPTDAIPSLAAMTAMINIDMVGREAPDSLYTVGSSRLSSEFGRWVDEVNGSLGSAGRPLFALDRSYDSPTDPEHIYERSDHYNYAKHGVPVAFFFDGMGADWRKGSPTDDYHRTTDDVDKIDFAKMARATRLVYALGRRAADAPVRPKVDAPATPAG